MKTKTSITLSEDVLSAIEELAGPGVSRSAFIERVLRSFVRQRRRAAVEGRELSAPRRPVPRSSTWWRPKTIPRVRGRQPTGLGRFQLLHGGLRTSIHERRRTGYAGKCRDRRGPQAPEHGFLRQPCQHR